MSDYYSNITIEQKEDSQLCITGEIPVERAHTYRDRAIARLGQDASIPGFRKGKVPPSMIAERLGEATIWNEIASLALADAYPNIIEEEKLNVVGRPQITITKLAPENPIGFSIAVSVLPEFTLPDYAKVAKDALSSVTDSEEISDGEIQKTIKTVRENHAHAQWHQDHPDDHSHDHEIKEGDLPVFDDAFVQSLGNFPTTSDFTEAIKRQLASEKSRTLMEKRRMAIAEALVEKTPFAVPLPFVESELNKMTAEFESSIGRMGMSVDEYLKHAEKDIASIRNEWKAEATKRAKLQIIVGKIAKEEGIEPDKEKLGREIAHIKEHYPDADPENVQAYVETLLITQAVFEFLEGGKKAADTESLTA